MIKLELTVDQVDYNALAEQLLPHLKNSGNPLGMMLGGGVSTEMVKRWLASMSQEKKEQLTVELLNANRDRLIQKASAALEKQGLPMHISGARASIVK